MVDKARARENGRNGIGLSICEKIAKIHNTKLIIESKLNKELVYHFIWRWQILKNKTFLIYISLILITILSFAIPKIITNIQDKKYCQINIL